MEEIARFLAEHPPFHLSSSQQRQRLAHAVQISFAASGSDILTQNGPTSAFLYVIRRGLVDLIRHDDQTERVTETLEPGECFGYVSLIRKRPPIVTVRARQDSLLYLIPAALFQEWHDSDPIIAQFFARSLGTRLDHALQQHHASATPELFQTRLRDLIQRPVVAIEPQASIRHAAKLMREQRVSCLLVDLPPYGVLDRQSGILTDRDLRNRVLAEGLSYDTPVSQVMSAPAVSLPADSLVFEAMLLMLERGIHHLPVSDQGWIVGLVTYTDILRRQSTNPLLLPRQLQRAQKDQDLRLYADQVAQSVVSLVDAGARVSDIGRMVAVAHDSLVAHILEEAEATLGPPPCTYAFVVLGSEGRYEQTLRTDQDNALIYADDAPADAETYFAHLAAYVINKLEQCGFPRCPGDVMATNPQWRQPLHTWQHYFQQWINQPDEESLLKVAIFFDMRPVYGALEIETALGPIIESASKHPVFLARLARAALRQPASLGLLQQFGMVRRDSQYDLFDLKLRGTATVVDLARLFALATGVSETNTGIRLRQAAKHHGPLDSQLATELIAAFDLLSVMRLRRQISLMRQHEEPSNVVSLSSLSSIERRDLKEAIRAVSQAQHAIEVIYQTGRLA